VTPAPLRIGVLGCADIALRRVLPAIAAAAGMTVVAVASRERGTAERTAREFGARAVIGYRALIERDDVEAVYVPLPPALHATWVREALLAGKHVLAEKPLTLDPVTTARLLALAGESGLVLMENVMFVHHGQHRAVRELLIAGTIGEPRFFRATFTVPRRPVADIRHRPELGGGALRDTGVYPVRAAIHLLGHDLEVVAASSARTAGSLVDTWGAAVLTDRRGVIAQLAYGLDNGYESSYELAGSEGRILVDRAFTPAPDHHPILRVEGPSGTRQIQLGPEDQVAATLAAFARAVRGPAPAGPEPATRDCLRQAELIDDIRSAGGG
jgi:NDP-hexose-3-ketoreductase